MFEDKILIWKLRHQSKEALCRIYEKYKDDMLLLATALSNNKSSVEDAVHDVFVSFAKNASKIEPKKSLKNYLLSCVVNRIRDINRFDSKNIFSTEQVTLNAISSATAETETISNELGDKINEAVQILPQEQREVIVLRLGHDMKFRQIAEIAGESIGTIRSRYRYGIDKLQTLLNSEVQK